MNGYDLEQEALTNPQFDALTVELADPIAGDPQVVVREVMATAVKQVLGTSAEDWTIEPVHATVPGAFDLFPPPGQEVTVPQAFDLKYALQEQAAVSAAEALFETTLDNVPESVDAPVGPPGIESAGINWFGQLTEPERNPLWSLALIKVQEIWEKTEGEGVTVGHPDSGYIPHPELDDSRILHDKERDFYDGDDNAQNPQDRGGNHGLSTASVILSGHDHLDGERFVIGVAPKAKIIPMRITRKGPPVFLFQSGPRRVRKAVYHAIDNNCDVISMSLGGVGESSLRRAIQEAVKQNIIVLAAAGNGVPFVVWPARYPETIAVAACTINRERWNLSSRGSTVDITAPGHNVWRAYYDENNQQAAKPSSGTSYATAVMGGVAALWLAFHGRDQLLAKYQDANVPLNEVFRRVLSDFSDAPPLDHHGQFGAGIVNVKKLLEADLPDPASFAAEITESLETARLPSTAVDTVAGVFETVPAQDVEERMAVVVNVPADELNSTLAGVEDELLFHMVTNPELRQVMVAGAPAGGAEVGMESTAPEDMSSVPGLSTTLRDRIGA